MTEVILYDLWSILNFMWTPCPYCWLWVIPSICFIPDNCWTFCSNKTRSFFSWVTSSSRIFSSLSRTFLLSSPILSSMMVSSFFSFSSWSLQISSSKITEENHDANWEWRRFDLYSTPTIPLTSLSCWSLFLHLIIKRIKCSFSILLFLLLPPGAGLLKLMSAGLRQSSLKDIKSDLQPYFGDKRDGSLFLTKNIKLKILKKIKRFWTIYSIKGMYDP